MLACNLESKQQHQTRHVTDRLLWVIGGRLVQENIQEVEHLHIVRSERIQTIRSSLKICKVLVFEKVSFNRSPVNTLYMCSQQCCA